MNKVTYFSVSASTAPQPLALQATLGAVDNHNGVSESCNSQEVEFPSLVPASDDNRHCVSSSEQQLFNTCEEAVTYLKDRAEHLGYRLTTGRVKDRKIYLVCHKNRTLGCGASFTIRHDAPDVWRIISRHDEHNHPPLTQRKQEIYESVKYKAYELASLGLDFGAIVKLLRWEFKEKQFRNRDISIALHKHFAEIRAVPQVEELLEAAEASLQGDNKFFFEYSVKSTVFQSAIWASSEMQDNLRNFWEVVLFDPTCLTNSLRLPFAFFLVVDANGRMAVAATCILANEMVESFVWAMTQFRRICISCDSRIPNVFYTDQCPAIHRALEIVFPTSCHLLCRWHLAKNIVKHLATVLRSMLQPFLHDFYTIAQMRRDEGAFDARWAETLRKYGVEDSQFAQNLTACKERWARCFHKSTLDFGITTTSRSESMNAWIKRLVNVRTRLATLFKVSVIDVSDAHHVKAVSAQMKAIRNTNRATSTPHASPLVKQAAKLLHDYPLAIFVEQLQRSIDYRGSSVDQLGMCGTVVHRVRKSADTVVLEPPSCSCGFLNAMGIPCRHYICLAVGLFQESLPQAAFHERWTLRGASAETMRVAIEAASGLQPEGTIGSYSRTPCQDRYVERARKLQELNRLYGEQLDAWLDACLAGEEVAYFPLPVYRSVLLRGQAPSAVPPPQHSSASVHDPAPSAGRHRKSLKSVEERFQSRNRMDGWQVPDDPDKAKGAGRPRRAVKPRRKVVFT